MGDTNTATMTTAQRKRKNWIVNRYHHLSILLLYQTTSSVAFTFVPHRLLHNRRLVQRSISLYSSIGGGREDRPGGSGGGNGNGNDKNQSPLDEWLSPENNNDNKEIASSRSKRADSRLPLNFRSDDGSRDEEFFLNDEQQTDESTATPTPNMTSARSSALDRIRSSSSSSAMINLDSLQNPYMDVISRLTPSEMILRFTSTSHPRVQEAVKQTVLGLIGNLPRSAFETTVVTTGERLAKLMFELQMTGYMFKNAEYRMAMSREVDWEDRVSRLLLKGSAVSEPEEEEEEEEETPKEKSVQGKIRVKYGWNDTDTTTTAGDVTPNNYEIEVDAAAYLSELREDVQTLRDELVKIRKGKEEAIQNDLLAYIRTLPPREMQQLTGTLSEDVLLAMKGLVNNVMKGIGGDKEEEKITPITVMEQTGDAMAQLCMWQLVVGYNLRELEVREEMKIALLKGGEEKQD